MKNLKLVKKQLSKQKTLANYQKVFKHKQVRFVFSKIAFYFQPNISIDFVARNEMIILDNAKNPDMYVTAFENFQQESKINYDWKSLGVFCFYAFQTSTYWTDTKKTIPNIFNSKNFVQLNSEKRNFFHNFVNSIPISTENLNRKITFVIERLF